ncbi:hypothetical protein LI82_12375 [Methanococcoides methylutens]|uniref:DUF2178 domain-containing protein n=1 Tax=Methanococcoides methylutens TaxID=2226 RepID=A0A099T004_METMT|nr:DUF2178 domain-containing protein [Methanococcoides methylutens]KGK98485.1 hypothetical protein LI82_12375 [Methanococcoides methylutens]
MAVDIISFIGVIVGVTIGFLIVNRGRKKSGEPEQDERTEKVAGKAANSSIIVLLLAMAVILWGDLFELFKIETGQSISILFFTLMISLITFRRHYSSKEI